MTGAPKAAITVGVEDSVATLTLVNPGRRNALPPSVWLELARSVEHLAMRPDVTILVITGHGDDFSTGLDLQDAGKDDADQPQVGSDGAVALVEAALADCPKPVIAAIGGYCIGAGMAVALACDLRIAAADASFAMTPAKIGVIYPASSIQLLLNQVGPSITKRMLFTAEFVDATQALRIGLVEEVVPVEELADSALALATVIGKRSQLTVQATKDIVRTLLSDPPAVSDRENFWVQESLDGPDQREGLRAFSERRDPVFTWRSPSSRR
ncbi:enoyl-CoA hydratase/isomerase family protein [Microbacterium aerolatum]|uniref:Enoyl-CoA hydratase n=1 Tax=Microbacterium aerolatum TaxID=153731 RepID=A0A511AE31_9MICO|nr:enoyl-CoA hydratase/isomerase family protein [Microbacterium aerolatum]GEK86418.1 enoyl-CoA hydratase [Microbacterium aerolatum]GGB22700.1 enoyl-CoA hydratase [Microbacterium aerolatum]